jgi:hypothetical protein
MTQSHSETLQSFARKLTALLMFRGAVRWTTIWFFVWGVVVLAARMAGSHSGDWQLLGLLGAIPLAVFAAIRERPKRAAFTQVRAAYDGLNRCGGVIMAEETTEMSAWHASLPKPASPRLRWRSGRSLGLLAIATVFVLVTLSLPDRFALLAMKRPLDIGNLVSELRAEVETLKQEKILEPNKAEELQKQLSRLKDQSSALDPNKTWEALDHMKESNSDLARQAAEEALSKTSNLTEAQTLASALQAASETGLGQDVATHAAKELASMLKAAKLQDGMLKSEMPEDLLAQLDGLNPEDLERLLSSIEFNKNNLGRTLTNLAGLKLIDPKKLSECKNVGTCPDPKALADFLCQNTNACSSMSLCELTASYCRGGIDRGRGDAPMTWKQESSDAGAKFKEDTLPPSTRLSDSRASAAVCPIRRVRTSWLSTARCRARKAAAVRPIPR